MKYLISGRNGQLARAFIKTFERESIDFIAPDESKLDITKEAIVAEAVAGYRPDVYSGPLRQDTLASSLRW